MIDNQFEIAKALENPARFPDQILQNYKRGMNPMIQPNIAAGEEQRRAMIRNAVQGMMARQGQQQQQQPQTIVEFEKQKLAQQQAMQQQLIDMLTSRGVGSLPTRPDMFSRGGGVIAFNGQGDSQYVSPEETVSPPSGESPKSIFQRLGEVLRPKNTFLQRPDNAVADQAIDIIKQVEGQIGYGDVVEIKEGRYGSTVEAITERLLGKPVSPKKAGQADVRKSEKEESKKEESTPDVQQTQSQRRGQQQTRPSGGGISTLENRLAGINKRTEEISKKLAKETESEELLIKAIKAEMKRSEEFKDLDEKQLDAVAQKRLDQMKKESDPLFKQMKENIQKRRSETVGMTPEERRELFIANLGAQGRGVRNLFGKSLEVDVRQRVEDRKLNQARQDLLDKEEMELARAEMLESRGQRKEADEARKLAMQAHRESENLRRQQAQLMLGSTEKLATTERRRQELAYKPEQEELRARREAIMKEYDADRARETSMAAAARASMSGLEKDFNFYKSRGYSDAEAMKKAEANSRAGQYALGQERLDATQASKILNSAKDNMVGQVALLKAVNEAKKDPQNPQKQQAVVEIERQLYGGYTRKELTDIAMGRQSAAPAGGSVLKFDAQGNPIK